MSDFAQANHLQRAVDFLSNLIFGQAKMFAQGKGDILTGCHGIKKSRVLETHAHFSQNLLTLAARSMAQFNTVDGQGAL